MMRNLQTNPNPRRSWILKSLTVMTLTLAALLPAQVIKAGIRVQARVRTPNVEIRVGNYRPHGHHEDLVPIRHFSYQEKKIAKRMARMSGVSKRQILRMRSKGMSWQRIGRRIGLDRYDVRVATGQQWHQKRYRRPFVNTVCRYP